MAARPQVNIRCTDADRQRLQESARRYGTTVSELVRQLPDLLEATRREPIAAP